jgi:hypothetical protein
VNQRQELHSFASASIAAPRRIAVAVVRRTTGFVAFATNQIFFKLAHNILMFRLCFRNEPQSSNELSVLTRFAFNLATVGPVVFHRRPETFLGDVSPPFTAAACADTSASVALNSKNHVSHHLSATGRHRQFGERRYWIGRLRKEGTPESTSPMLLAGLRLNDPANQCRHRCSRHRHRFGRPNLHYHYHDHLIHLLP